MTRSVCHSAITGEEIVGDLNIVQGDLNILQCKLRKKFEDKKYLLVIDGYTDVSSYDWKKFSLPFAFGKFGSAILITTQSSRVASVVGSDSTYSLKPLEDENCWSIMKEFAFSRHNMKETEIFAYIGKQVAKKSCELPLLVVAFGSMLSFKLNHNIWESMSRSELWKLPQIKSLVLPLFIRSYTCFPAELKMCFVYSSLFPPNHLFNMDDLVRLLVVEWFIQHVAEISVEQIGRDYFMDLLSMFIFQIVEVSEKHPKYKMFGRHSAYKMHAIFSGMGKMLSKGMCFRLEEKTFNWDVMLRTARHVSIDKSVMDLLEQNKCKKKQTLRTFMVTDKRDMQAQKDDLFRISIPFAIIEKMDFLRLLLLCGCDVVKLPTGIGLLEHLRYLNLSSNSITLLPDKVCNLLGLQTLKVKNCMSLERLPKNISRLVNLHQLDIDIGQLHFKPLKLGKLTALQFLEEFIVEKEKDCRIEELGTMNLLEGSLTISNLENVQRCDDASKAKLCEKPYLNVLKLGLITLYPLYKKPNI